MTEHEGRTAAWDLAGIRRVYELPITTLLFEAQRAHRRFHDGETVQLSALLSIKTGRCPEDCAYCPQSAHYATEVEAHPLLDPEKIVERARCAKDAGATRFCMGAAWRSPPAGEPFAQVLTAVEAVAGMNLEVCCTLGMLTREQAELLRIAGCSYYNHNLDTSRAFYPKIITTRVYDDRLETLRHARAVGMKLCCGGIIGMGESLDDRLALLAQLAEFEPAPESVPINVYVPVAGTPLAERPPIDPWELVRLIATARIVMPRTEMRLSAGRTSLDESWQALCFLAGANSIFFGEKLLTTENPGPDEDGALLRKLGLKPLQLTEAECRESC